MVTNELLARSLVFLLNNSPTRTLTEQAYKEILISELRATYTDSDSPIEDEQFCFVEDRKEVTV